MFPPPTHPALSRKQRSYKESEDAAFGLNCREPCGNSVRSITLCKYSVHLTSSLSFHGIDDDEGSTEGLIFSFYRFTWTPNAVK